MDETVSARFPKYLLMACLALALIGVFLLIARMSTTGYTGFDLSLSEAIRALRNSTTEIPMLIATLLGNGLVVTVAMATLCAVLLYQRQWPLVVAILTTVAASGIFVSSIKPLTHAIRPESDLYSKGVSVFSFPSGHTTFSTLLGLWLIWFTLRGVQKTWARVLIVLVLFSMICMVGLSRIYLGAHWPTDVAAGFLFSSSLLLIVALIYAHYFIEPAAALQVLKWTTLAYVLTGIIYVSYKWPSAILMYTPST